MSQALDVVEEASSNRSSSRRIVLGIEGMTCTACSSRVERALNKLNDVTASVNFVTGRATVDVLAAAIDRDGVPLGEEALAAVVTRCGYTPVVTEPGAALPSFSTESDRARMLWKRLVVALLLFIPLADFAIVAALVPSVRFTGWQWILVVLCLPVVTWCAWPFHRAALKNARQLTGTMDTLVSAGITVSTIWSFVAIFTLDRNEPEPTGLWSAMTHSGSIYLETAAGITVLVLGGRYLEARARARAGSAVRDLAAMAARDVVVQLPDGSVMRLPAVEVRVGHRVLVLPGDRIAVDGTVLEGSSAIDTSALTGESMPRDVHPGDQVRAGFLASSGRLVIETTAVGSDTHLGEMIRLIEQAQADKSAVQRRIDRISSIFVPVVLAIAVLSALIWWLAGADIARAITVGLGILVVACPCSLGLATPVALLAAAGRGARAGIFIKSQQALDAAGGIDVVMLDKTGTLTTGTQRVTHLLDSDGTQLTSPEWLPMAGALEGVSQHPFARAVAAAASKTGDLEQKTIQVANVTDNAGAGISGLVEGRTITIGRADRWGLTVPLNLDAALSGLSTDGNSTAVVAIDNQVVGAISTADTVKPSAEPTIAALKARGIRTVVLSGDTAGAVTTLTNLIGADESRADLTPADKVAAIRQEQASGRRVAMVGDGINDGPALATADLGIAVGRGTDVALEAADIVLVQDDLNTVIDTLQLSTDTLRTIRWNLLWAFGYNTAAIPIAIAGLANPLLASAAMACSSLLVVVNSLRLERGTTPEAHPALPLRAVPIQNSLSPSEPTGA